MPDVFFAGLVLHPDDVLRRLVRFGVQLEVELKYRYGKPYNIDTNGSDFAELILTPKG